MYWRRRLSRLEVAIYAVVVAVVLTAFLERLLYYMELAERTAMEVTVSYVNSGLDLRQAYGMLATQSASDPAASARNPFELAAMSPGNFLGEMDSPRLADLERGNWVFDRAQKELIYLPRLRRGLDTADPNGAIHFKLEARGGNRSRLVPTLSFTWE
jgi:general secretion pathway protein G